MNRTRAVLLSTLLAAACDKTEHAPTDAAPATNTAELAAAPLREGEGCARAGPIDAIERDPTCLIGSPDPRDAQNVSRGLTMSARLDSANVVPGGTTNLRISVANTGRREIPIVLEARVPGAAGRPDWARLAGMPAPQGAPAETFRTSFLVRTLDARDLSVDRLPLVPPATEPVVHYLRVRVAPGATLTQAVSWWALGIPAPYPPFKDDAGHRIVPQTAPRPLAPGDYTISVEVPVYGLLTNERTIATTVRVMTDTSRDDASPPRP